MSSKKVVKKKKNQLLDFVKGNPEHTVQMIDNYHKIISNLSDMAKAKVYISPDGRGSIIMPDIPRERMTRVDAKNWGKKKRKVKK